MHTIKLFLPFQKQFIDLGEGKDLEATAIQSQKKLLEQNILSWIIYIRNED